MRAQAESIPSLSHPLVFRGVRVGEGVTARFAMMLDGGPARVLADVSEGDE